jgi:hypothetical protein
MCEAEGEPMSQTVMIHIQLTFSTMQSGVIQAHVFGTQLQYWIAG